MSAVRALSGGRRRRWEERWRTNRARARAFFDEILPPEAYFDRPIALRHPFVFYDGHLAAFAVNVLLKEALGKPGIDASLERLFARGIDPAVAAAAPGRAWPPRDDVRAYVARADGAVSEALARAPEDVMAEAAPLVLEHEEMHHETLLYMHRRLPLERRGRRVSAAPAGTDAAPPARSEARIPSGLATLGARRGGIPFGWDNEFPARVALVPGFSIDVHPVTNADWIEFVEAGGYTRESLWPASARAWRASEGVAHPAFWVRRDGAWRWRGAHDEPPLPPAWPVWVSHAEASAYAAWRGRRLPTEAEYHRAAFARPDGSESDHPWGEAAPSPAHGNFDFQRGDPVPCGSHPAGASAWGVHDLVGNGWEWTSTAFGPFEGFRAMPLYPGYSEDFFDGAHAVLKGASPATAAPLLRRSFRNWFRTEYPYVFAKFRTVGA